MIHHISIAVENPFRVAKVLAEIFQGAAYDFPPCPGSYIICPHDEFGTAIEVYPLGTEILPGQADEAQAFVPATAERKFTSVHAAISVPTTLEVIQRIGAREQWRTVLCDRGPFHVIEFWVENWLMLEFLPPAIAAEYLAFTQSETIEQFLGEPIQFAVAV
jgi:hypothetical protein